MRRILSGITAVTIAASSVLMPGEARADFPEKAITVILPFGPGGGTDLLTRSFDTFTREVFGQNFVIEYRPGGGGAIGTTAIAGATPDGYTIGMGSLPHMFLQPAAGAGDFTIDDFDYVALVSREPQIILTPGESPYTTYEELKAAAQEEPGRMTLGIPSPLSETWLAYEMINAIEELGFTLITYQGGGALNAALLGNQVDAAIHNIGPVYGEIESLNVLAVTSSERVSYLPDVPTFAELGVNVDSHVERVFIAPKGVPEDRLEILREGFREIWHSPEFQARMVDMRYGVRWVEGAEVRTYLDQQSDAVLKIYNQTLN